MVDYKEESWKLAYADYPNGLKQKRSILKALRQAYAKGAEDMRERSAKALEEHYPCNDFRRCCVMEIRKLKVDVEG